MEKNKRQKKEKIVKYLVKTGMDEHTASDWIFEYCNNEITKKDLDILNEKIKSISWIVGYLLTIQGGLMISIFGVLASLFFKGGRLS